MMNKDQILSMAQNEGREKDLPDLEAQKSGAWIAYIIGVVLLIVVDTVNGFVLHYVNRGADFVLFSMACAVFVTKYIRLRKNVTSWSLPLFGAFSRRLCWLYGSCS